MGKFDSVLRILLHFILRISLVAKRITNFLKLDSKVIIVEVTSFGSAVLQWSF